MPGSFTIELKGLRFFAEHGLYPAELKVGNEFEVDVSIDTEAPEETISTLDQTIDYVTIFQIVQEEFNKHQYLLETCAMNIANQVGQKCTAIKTITISIRKLNPPITNFRGSVVVTYTKIFN